MKWIEPIKTFCALWGGHGWYDGHWRPNNSYGFQFTHEIGKDVSSSNAKIKIDFTTMGIKIEIREIESWSLINSKYYSKKL